MVTKKKRMKLHEDLCDILGSRNCYFSPPSSIHMKYPCIVYEAGGDRTTHADDIRYLHWSPFTLTVIDENPDSEIPERLFNSRLSHLSHDRTYVADGMYHFVFTTYILGG